MSRAERDDRGDERGRGYDERDRDRARREDRGQDRPGGGPWTPAGPR
ncbi:hypothetical protein SAZ11_05480 [Streptomyces sp. FXJ1.4098]|nr:hypothetical protein [Streptomyces sp. FXJ1.4098]